MSFSPFELSERDSIFLKSLTISPRIRVTRTWLAGKKSLLPPVSSNHETLEAKIENSVLVHVRAFPEDSLNQSASQDSLGDDTICYKELSDFILNRTSKVIYEDFVDLSKDLFHSIIRQFGCKTVELMINVESSSKSTEKEFGSHSFRGLSITHSFKRPEYYQLRICDLRFDCLIGLLEFERCMRQPVVINLTFWSVKFKLNVDKILSEVSKNVMNSNFFTVEALADSISKQLIDLAKLKTFRIVDSDNQRTNEGVSTVSSGTNGDEFDFEKLSVTVDKPDAISSALGAGVEICRSVV
ncbi:Dihydroneopterin aldolase-domain-containing protein [Phakopsora pachyrhizi]|uniref:Dihydroneopterin aldolase-domain-containing protein n=1 Tax=Phakopsora pachyrhizi TaxID=170000 RepID=A0AAV0AFH9_PHAPC|nr:Dihydroneopterin aldolase-domain-containing protein [Phakopsora pachyrhizi]